MPFHQAHSEKAAAGDVKESMIFEEMLGSIESYLAVK